MIKMVKTFDKKIGNRIYKNTSLVEMETSKNTINLWLKVYNQEKVNVSRLYITYEELEELVNNRYVIVRDGYNFSELRINENTLHIEYFDIDINHYSGNLKGKLFVIDIDYNVFIENLRNREKGRKWKQLSIKKYSKAQVSYSGKNLSKVRKNKTQWNMLKKQLANLANWQDEQIIITDDFIENSFYFRAFNNDKPGINGGIIWHKNLTMPTYPNITGYYSIHT